MSERPVTHATFTIERTYGHPQARVFAALADPDARARWMVTSEEVSVADPYLATDFRVSGVDISHDGPAGETP